MTSVLKLYVMSTFISVEACASPEKHNTNYINDTGTMLY